MKDTPVNGKIYPMWGGLVDAQDKFIDGKLTDLDGQHVTRIIGLRLYESCGSVIFEVMGEHFVCAVNVKYGGLSAREGGGFYVSVASSTGFEIEPK